MKANQETVVSMGVNHEMLSKMSIEEIEELERVVNQSDQYEVYYDLVHAYIEKGQFESAWRCVGNLTDSIEKLILTDSDDLRGLLLQAMAYEAKAEIYDKKEKFDFAEENYNKALSCYEKIIKLSYVDHAFTANMRSGIINEKRNKLPSAWESYIQARICTNQGDFGYDNEEKVEYKSKVNSALQRIIDLTERDTPGGCKTISNYYDQMGNETEYKEKSLFFYEKYRELGGKIKWFDCIKFAELYDKIGDNANAEDHYTKAIQLRCDDPEHLSTHLYLADIYFQRGIAREKRGNTSKALDDFMEVTKLTDRVIDENDENFNWAGYINTSAKLKIEISQRKSLQERMQKMVEQYSHSLANTIFPATIQSVAERLKNHLEFKKDALLLYEAYQAEITIKLESELLRKRYSSNNPEHFRQLVRQGRALPDSDEPKRNIQDILDHCFKRVIGRFLNQNYAKLNTIRNKMIGNKDLLSLRSDFEEKIFFLNINAIDWMNLNIKSVRLEKVSDLWDNVWIDQDSYAEALFLGYFSELLFNAFVYSDHDKKDFLTIELGSVEIDKNIYLYTEWVNPISETIKSTESGNGLQAIKEDLMQLNNTDSDNQSLEIKKGNDQFKIRLLLKKDILVASRPISFKLF